MSNGLAGPFPRNRIIAYIQPPASDPALANHDDWLELLILHELVHIFHLDYAGGVWSPLRSILGRDPRLFPEVFVPGWFVEGLATYIESEHSAGGRARGSDFDMLIRAAVLDDQLFPVDRASLDPVAWPAGNTRYLYGSLFVDYLAGRYGPEEVSDFIRNLGGQLIPYRVNAAARRAFGRSLSDSWTDWQAMVREQAAEQIEEISRHPVSEPEMLTGEGRVASYPRFSPAGRLAYAASDGRSDPAQRVRIGDRWLDLRVNTVGAPSWIDERRILVSQLDFVDPYNIRSDLYVLDMDGESRRITRGARLWEPDYRPESHEAVAVQASPGSNVLTRVDLDTGAIMPITQERPDVYWSSPAWSPDGQRIAASRWSAGSRADIVILDQDGHVVRTLTEGRALDMFPVWTEDGRHLLFTSDRTGVFNLYAYDLESDRLWQVTNVLTGALQGDVSPAGDEVVFSWARGDGFHIARLPWDPDTWIPAEISEPAVTLRDIPQAPRTPSRDYSPWETLPPTYWSPVADFTEDAWLGFAISGEDLVERHLWWTEMLTDVSGPRFMGGFGYRYRGLGNPTLGIGAEQEWVAYDELDGGLDRRQRDAELSIDFRRRRWRSVGWLDAGLDLEDTDYFDLASDSIVRTLPLDLGSFVELGISTARNFGLSLDRQNGALGSVRLQSRRYLGNLGPDIAQRTHWRATARTRAYRALDWFGFAPPTLALRLDGGLESSDAAPGFTLGSTTELSSGVPSAGGGGSRSTYPLRGYPSGVQFGNRVVSGTAEYRFPIRLVERGLGLFPLSLDRLWGDVFVDGGTAWCPGGCSLRDPEAATSPDPLFAVGAEAIIDLGVGYGGSIPLRFGVAVPLGDGGHSLRGYFRVGTSF